MCALVIPKEQNRVSNDTANMVSHAVVHCGERLAQLNPWACIASVFSTWIHNTGQRRWREKSLHIFNYRLCHCQTYTRRALIESWEKIKNVYIITVKLNCVLGFPVYFRLSYEVASECEITLWVKRFTVTHMANPYRFHATKYFKIILTSYDKQNLTFVLLYYWIYQTLCEKKEIKCSASRAFYFISSTRLINSIKH